ncbi:hypothetical protein N7523_007454 [Penicillium sp. IBT 18751x]|nr:hypothetical protein N7523_007454 [Penicillium sp. IBT 18751x]
MAPTLEYAFTLEVNLTPALDFGNTHCGHRRYIPIAGGTVDGPKLKATILNGGGDWNALREDGMGHVFAKYTIQAADGTLISVTNEGWIRKFEPRATADSERVESEWYAKTNPRFEVQDGPHGWLNRTLFVGELQKPDRPNHVTIDVYSVE